MANEWLTIHQTVPGSVNGRTFVDPDYPEDVLAATYRETLRMEMPVEETEIRDHLEIIFSMLQDQGAANKGVRSLASGDVIGVHGEHAPSSVEFWMILPVGFRRVQRQGDTFVPVASDDLSRKEREAYGLDELQGAQLRRGDLVRDIQYNRSGVVASLGKGWAEVRFPNRPTTNRIPVRSLEVVRDD